jgi:hypothetical protein
VLAERLPNGNTLINASPPCVTSKKRHHPSVVWEYVNPYFVPANEPAGAQDNFVFRVYRYSEKEIVQARKAT